MASSTITRIPQLDVQFAQGSAYDPVKLQRMVAALTTVITNVNNQNAQIAAIAAEESAGVAKHVFATETGLGPEHTVSGLVPGNVVVATSGTTAEFAALKFSQLAQVDPNSFANPAQEDVIAFIDGYWTATAQNPLNVSDPGQNALLMWTSTDGGLDGNYAWAIPDSSLILTPGALTVNQGVIDHANLRGLYYVEGSTSVIANDHPQYALLAAGNTWDAQQTFELGLVSESDIDLFGNFEQVSQEPEYRIQNTDDIVDEGIWRMHAEPGQLIFSTVSDDGSDGENWLCVTRIAELADAVNVQSNSFTYNGFDVMCIAAPAGGTYITVRAGDVNYQLLTTAYVTAGVPGGGTVTSISISSPGSTVSVGGGPITGAGTLTVDLPVIGTIAPGAYTNSDITVDAYGRITLIASGSGGGGSGTVTSVGLGTTTGFLTVAGGTNPVISSGTLEVDISSSALTALMTTETLAASALQPITGLSGSYTNADLTVNADGQITAISNGSGGGGSNPYNVTPDTHGAIPTGVGLGPNDEFEYSTSLDTAGARYASADAWITVNWSALGGTTTAPVAQGNLQFISEVNPSGTRDPQLAVIPLAGGWVSYVAKFNVNFQGGGGNLGGIVLYEIGTGKTLEWSAFNGANSSFFNRTIPASIAQVGSTSTNPMPVDSFTGTYPYRYFRVLQSGANVVFQVSLDGIMYTTLTSGGTLAIATYFTTAPTHIGFVIEGVSSSVATILNADFIRQTA